MNDKKGKNYDAESEEQTDKEQKLKLEIVKKFDILVAKLLKKYKPIQCDELFSLFDLLKCQIEYVINKLRDKKNKNSYTQIFVLYFQDLSSKKRILKITFRIFILTL